MMGASYAGADWFDRGVVDSIMSINKEIDERRNSPDAPAKADKELTKMYNRQLMMGLRLQCLPGMGWNNNITR